MKKLSLQPIQCGCSNENIDGLLLKEGFLLILVGMPKPPLTISIRH